MYLRQAPFDFLFSFTYSRILLKHAPCYQKYVAAYLRKYSMSK